MKTAPGAILRDLIRHRRFLIFLALRDLKQRYAGTHFGAVWALIQPLLLLGVYLLVFGVIIGVRFETGAADTGYGIYLLCGMIPWLGLQESVLRATGIIEENSNFVKYFDFPIVLLPVQLALGATLVQAVLSLLFTGLILFSQGLGPALILLPVVMAVQFLLTAGLSLMVSLLSLILKDIGQMVQSIVFVWFFATPIVYPAELIPAGLRGLFMLNPMVGLIDAYRAIWLGSPWPGLTESIVAAAIILGLALASLALASRLVSPVRDLL